MSGRLPRPISRTSRKPAVVTSAVRAPLRSVSALMTTVVPCTNSSTVGEVDLARGDHVEHALREVARRRRDLRDAHLAGRLVDDDEVGEGAADVGGDAQRHRARSLAVSAVVELERCRVERDAVVGARLRDGQVAVEHVLAHALRLALERVAEAAAGAGDGADDGAVGQLDARDAAAADVARRGVVYSR